MFDGLNSISISMKLCMYASIAKHVWEKLQPWGKAVNFEGILSMNDQEFDGMVAMMTLTSSDHVGPKKGSPWFDDGKRPCFSASLKTGYTWLYHQIDCNVIAYDQLLGFSCCFNSFWCSQLDQCLPHISTQWIWSVVACSLLRCFALLADHA